MALEAVKNYTRLQAPVFTDLDKIPVLTFFQTLFTSGTTIIEQDASAIDTDIQRGNKEMADYIRRGTDAKNVGPEKKQSLLEKFTSDSKFFPLIEEETPITSALISKRMPGESVQNPMSRIEKQIALAMKAHRQDMIRIIRRMEFSASEAFRTGLQTVHAGLKYDYYRKSTHNVAPITVWSDSANAVPLSDLAIDGNLVFRDGNRIPTDAIFGDLAWKEFLDTAQILALADSRRIVHFVADMSMPAPPGYEDWIAAGASFQGQVKAGQWKLNMWTYPAIYDDDAGTQTEYLPEAEVIVMAKGARYDRYFGPMDRLEEDDDIFARLFGLGDMDGIPENVVESGIFSSDMFHVDVYGGVTKKAFVARTQVGPIFYPIEADTIVKQDT